jgi:hypothetical protein
VPLSKAAVRREGGDLSVITYGWMVHVALNAAKKLAAEGIEMEVVDLRTLVPLDREAVLATAKKTSKVILLHEDTLTGGLGGELAGIIADKGVGLSANSRGGETRLETAGPTIEAIRDSFPLGTGPGSFEAVFPGYEDPADVRPIFMNHAHNDWLELVLEAGLAGMLLAAGGFVWFIVQLLRVWTPGADGMRRLQRAASISLGVLLLHSVVDYPLRTPAVACVAALLLALLAARDTETAVESSREGTSPNPAAI